LSIGFTYALAQHNKRRYLIVKRFTIILTLIGIVMALTTNVKLSAQSSRFTISKDGIITDSKTGLQWLEGPDRDITWQEAKLWVGNLSIGGGNWRMPTLEEVASIYWPSTKVGGTWIRPGNVDPLFKTIYSKDDRRMPCRDVWSGQLKDSTSAHIFGFDCGNESGLFKIVQDIRKSENMRVLAVRSKK
jgi:hypothetical protein